jgi:hypothetical protein
VGVNSFQVHCNGGMGLRVWVESDDAKYERPARAARLTETQLAQRSGGRGAPCQVVRGRTPPSRVVPSQAQAVGSARRQPIDRRVCGGEIGRRVGAPTEDGAENHGASYLVLGRQAATDGGAIKGTFALKFADTNLTGAT